jgi:hypothetical protein
MDRRSPRAGPTNPFSEQLPCELFRNRRNKPRKNLANSTSGNSNCQPERGFRRWGIVEYAPRASELLPELHPQDPESA